jgi:3D-(3,5/4)-trihydroxycyclohexane-1,2-dione acylhydrolase (decyclizing)
VDLAANAASLGMDVLRAKTVRELRSALAEARASDRPTCVYVETDPTPTAPPAEAWWDVPVAEVATREPARQARERYDAQVTGRRRHL